MADVPAVAETAGIDVEIELAALRPSVFGRRFCLGRGGVAPLAFAAPGLGRFTDGHLRRVCGTSPVQILREAS